jgi:hypothetical protein
VRAGYLAAARSQEEQSGEGGVSTSVYTAPIVVVDASADSDTVFERIQRAVLAALSGLRGS